MLGYIQSKKQRKATEALRGRKEGMKCKNCGHKIIKTEFGFKHDFEVLDEGIGKDICNASKSFFRSDVGQEMVEICGCFNPEPEQAVEKGFFEK